MVPVARPGAALLAAAVLVLVGACSGSAGGGGTSPSPATSAAHTPAEVALPPSGGIGSMDCGDTALLRAPAEALAVFPDNSGVEWTARPANATLGELLLVSLTPLPDEVGYPEFRFVYRCDAGGPARIAVYALDGGRFVLLATSDALAGEELPDELVWEGPVAED